jgi:hypothetical protein
MVRAGLLPRCTTDRRARGLPPFRQALLGIAGLVERWAVLFATGRGTPRTPLSAWARCQTPAQCLGPLHGTPPWRPRMRHGMQVRKVCSSGRSGMRVPSSLNPQLCTMHGAHTRLSYRIAGVCTHIARILGALGAEAAHGDADAVRVRQFLAASPAWVELAPYAFPQAFPFCIGCHWNGLVPTAAAIVTRARARARAHTPSSLPAAHSPARVKC